MFTDSQAVALASELNHILWTPDQPRLDPSSQLGSVEYPLKGNMQCAAHAVVCAALLLRRGSKVLTRSGSALVVYPNQPKTEHPHLILKHWWITAPNGLCDLSLNLCGLSDHKPVIYRNANLADASWKLFFKDDFKTVLAVAEKSLESGVCGVFYQTDRKLELSKEACESDLVKPFPPSLKTSSPIRYLDIVLHCEQFLEGRESVRGLPQEESWARVAMVQQVAGAYGRLSKAAN